MCPGLKVMIEFVLIAHLHLFDGRLGPDMVIDFYPTHSECRERAENAEDIVAMIIKKTVATVVKKYLIKFSEIFKILCN